MIMRAIDNEMMSRISSVTVAVRTLLWEGGVKVSSVIAQRRVHAAAQVCKGDSLLSL